MSNLRGRKKSIIVISILIIVILKVLVARNFKGEVNSEVIKNNLKIRINECKFVYENMEESEEKYKKLLETEEESFKKGVYSSALVQFYIMKNDDEKIIKYGKEAVENYNKVKGGEYYSIEEKENLAWALFKTGKYSESLQKTSELIQIITSSGNEILTTDELKDTEAFVYSMLLCIYSKLGIFDKAELYYNKLCEIELTPQLQASKGDKIAMSKTIYAEEISDLDLMKKYAEECYEIRLMYDKEKGNKSADSVILNLAIANVKLGEFEVAIKQIKKSEEFFISVGDSDGISNTYFVYAQYYAKVNQNELAIEYYKKTINLYNELEDYYNLQLSVYEFIKFLKENDKKEDINKYYEIFYDISKKISESKDINELLSQIINKNYELNNNALELLENESKSDKRNIIIGGIVIIVLSAMVIRMDFLIKKKDESEKILEKVANTDYLTEINTRAYGEKLILDEINKNNKFSMAIIDIDNFKNINDSYGHIFGDVILKKIAKKLKESIDSKDIIARFGGEEFIIAFVGKDKDEAKEILDEIRIDVNNIIFEHNVKASFSAGIEEWDKTSFDLVIKKADELLYKAKREGKNKVVNR
ncbi:tetratricopeptide repeat-containing diguanylate cyclase [Clostridium gasigenes]|uniref:Diguanylate cyclase (GGDEF) domain-containing protein n=1 Tax=Clostridium gasigenes TaxID=94869 RepID=A0A1H0MJN8_9CLOT|nr:tetratricopeptide repeat-containing diguanylate cyclase [Clostridium gasigenes]SDO80571.1 diguanylate cyclase (GGDEF) domain-containing protein [Clostridium gasigenes]